MPEPRKGYHRTLDENGLSAPMHLALDAVRKGHVYASINSKGVEVFPRRWVKVLVFDTHGDKIPNVRRQSLVALEKRGLVTFGAESGLYPGFHVVLPEDGSDDEWIKNLPKSAD
jgi:hypothetical protein